MTGGVDNYTGGGGGRSVWISEKEEVVFVKLEVCLPPMSNQELVDKLISCDGSLIDDKVGEEGEEPRPCIPNGAVTFCLQYGSIFFPHSWFTEEKIQEEIRLTQEKLGALWVRRYQTKTQKTPGHHRFIPEDVGTRM